MGFVTVTFEVIPIPGLHLSLFWTNYSAGRSKLDCRRDFQGIGKVTDGTSQGKMGGERCPASHSPTW